MNARPDTAQAAADAQLPAEFRSALQLAQAAVWDWQLSADRFQVDEAWVRAFGVDVSAAPMPVREWQRRIHPDDLGAFNAAADSCQHGSDRFECEYRLLAAGHRWLWVLHRGRVVQRERDGSAARITGLLLDIDRRKSEEVARSDSESRLATALWGARAAFWQWHVPSNARTASPLWLAMTGYSRAQWDATPNPWFSNLHPEDRERVDRQLREHAQGERDSVEFEYRFQTASGEYRWMQDRGRAVEWDLSRPPGAGDRRHARHRCREARRGAPRLERAHARDRRLGRGHRPVGNQFPHRHHALVQRLVRAPRHRPLRRRRARRRAGTRTCTRTKARRPRGVSRSTSTARPSTTTPSTASARAAGNGAGCSSAAAWSSATQNGKAVRMLGVCMDLDETKVAERPPNARNERVEAALQLTTAGVWDWDVENGITHNTDGYYRVFGVDPDFGHANHMNWRQLLGHRPRPGHRRFPPPPAAGRSGRAGAGDRVPLSPHRRQLALGAGPRLRGGARARRRHPARARPGGRHHRTQDARNGAFGRRSALPRGRARTALRHLRNRRRDRTR